MWPNFAIEPIFVHAQIPGSVSEPYQPRRGVWRLRRAGPLLVLGIACAADFTINASIGGLPNGPVCFLDQHLVRCVEDPDPTSLREKDGLLDSQDLSSFP